MEGVDAGCLRIGLLGSVRASRGATVYPLGPPQQRAVLAVLALAAGQPVSRDELVNTLWPETPPARAANIIQTHVKHLRQVLEPNRPSRAASTVLPAVGPGYALRTEPSAVDALRFRDLVATARAARRAGDTARVWQVARSAVDLWGTPVADVPALATHPRVAALVTEWQLVLGWYAEIATARGRADEVVPILEEQAHQRPLDEPVQTLLLRAYAALGRRSDAFAVYAGARRRLAAELGVDAGPQLRSAYDELLRDASTATRPADAVAPASARGTADPPAQLPARVRDFVGRADELAGLDRAVGRDGQSGTVAIVGPPGVGKTALGLTWAHRAAAHFPDGQLYVDLRGFGPDAPLHPVVVLERFLRALDVPRPAQPEELAARFRTHLATRRVMVFLDNAASAEQVEPLLPGQGASIAVVTSRRRLDRLVALHGATRVGLGPLPGPDALELIGRLATPGSDPDALSDLARLCDRLPLAVRIACSRLDPAAGFGVSELAAAMADERTRLDELATESGEISVRAVYATSIGALDPASQRVLRLLSAHPGPRPSLAAVAALSGLPVSVTRQIAARLVAAHLLVPAGPGRYMMHDLVRLIAREEAALILPAASREDAIRRLLDWYRDTADSADATLRPGQRPNFTTPARPDVFADGSSAYAWLDGEAENLVAAVEYAAGPHPRAAWQIAAAMFGWLNRSHNRAQWAALYTLAVDAAARAGDPVGEALIAGRLAVAHSQLGDTGNAVLACHRAHRLRKDQGDRLGAATALLNLGAVYLDRDEPGPAVEWLHRAADELGDAAAGAGHFTMLLHSNLGRAHRLTRRFAAAARHLDAALALGLATGKASDNAQILIELSRLCLDTGDAPGALAHARRAVDQAGQASDAFAEAEAQECVGRALLARGDAAAARRALTAALTAYDSMGHRSTDELRALMSVPGGPRGARSG